MHSNCSVILVSLFSTFPSLLNPCWHRWQELYTGSQVCLTRDLSKGIRILIVFLILFLILLSTELALFTVANLFIVHHNPPILTRSQQHVWINWEYFPPVGRNCAVLWIPEGYFNFTHCIFCYKNVQHQIFIGGWRERRWKPRRRLQLLL